MFLKSIFLLLFYSVIGRAQGYMELKSNGPIVRGANLTLSAVCLDCYLGVDKKFVFRNVEKKETVEILSSENVVNYTIKINKREYKAGLYAFEVRVYTKDMYSPEQFSIYDTARIRVSITDTLNGKLKIIQNGIDKTHGVLYSKEQVSHVIQLSKEEEQFLTDDNTYLVHWYINCSLVSLTGLTLNYTYEDRYKPYYLEAVIEVETDPNQISFAKTDKLPGFKCAKFNSGNTYGYYRAIVRADATSSSPPPPSSISNTWPDSFYESSSPVTFDLGSTDSSRGYENSSPDPNNSEYRPWRPSERTPWNSGRTTRRYSWRTTESTPWKASERTSWNGWRTTERNRRPIPARTPTPDSSNTGTQKDCATNANNTQISVNNGHLKIAMDLVFNGTFNITSLEVEEK